MEKKYALFIAFFITLVIAGNWLFFYDFSEFEREKVLISKVLDGDTVELEDGRRIRLLNINAEEKARAFGDEALNYLKEFENKEVELEKEGVDLYGRILGRIYFENDYLNLKLVEIGLAHKYLVDENELKEFERFEDKAREQEIGIWKKSEHYGCLSASINKKEEYVIIEDSCGLNFNVWTLKDESTKQYKFKDISFDSIKIYSEKGDDSQNELYWGRGKAWNDDKDAIFIRDSEGFLVYYDSYS